MLQNVSFITEKKTEELIEKVAVLGGSHQVELLKNMVYFNTRKHTNEAILYTVNGIEDAIIRRKKIDFCLNEKAERVYVTINDSNKKRYYVEPVARIDGVSEFTEQVFKIFSGELA